MDTSYDNYSYIDDIYIYDSFYMTKNKIYNYIQHEDDNLIKYRLKNSLLFLIYNKGMYKDNIYIYGNCHNKYYPYKSKIYNCSNELKEQWYNSITKTLLYFFLIYEYNYIGNYIYGRRNNQKIDDKYKFISNWQICILFI
jgi:hypothetical protein